MKKKFYRFALVLMFVFSLIAILGCENGSRVNHTNSDIASQYTITNNSSYTVTLWDSTASKTLEPGQQLKAFFNNEYSIYDVRYAPADKVKVVGSGLSYQFIDK